PAVPVGWGEVAGEMADMQGRFNLRNLVTAEGTANAPAVERFRRLLRALELPPGIADAATDWADADNQPTGGWGAEDGFYAGRQPAYLAANRPFGEAAELRLVRRVDAEAWDKLKAHVVALPEPTGVNLNTATAPVLAAYIKQWGPPRVAMRQAEKWVERTNKEPFADKGAFASAALGAQDGSAPPKLTVTTQYFMAKTRFRFGEVNYGLATLYHRSGGEVSIVRHRREIR
ncbi:MAG: type II secretion system minor pseudopilin GspK, partial [Thiohalorhabdaceae bacterium]